MADKILNTRIQLKYDTLANWKEKNTLLKQGEVAFVQIGEAGFDAQGRRIAPPVMFKVGPGNFNELDWGSAVAADVYGWAKQDTLPIVRNDAEGQAAGNVISSISWDSANNKVIYTTASVATSEGMADLQEALEGLTNTINGMYTNEQIDAAIKVVADNLATHIEAFGEFQIANTKAIADAVAAEAEIARNAEQANADAIAAIKDDADIDSFADVKAELIKKQNTIPANTYDTYGSAATAEQNAKDYADSLANNYDATGSAATAEQNAKNYADQIKSDLLGTEELEGTYDTLKEIGKWIEDSGVDATELSGAIAEEKSRAEAAEKAINDTLATYGDIVTHDAADFQVAGNYETAGAAASALEEAKKYTDDEIAELDLANTYEAKGTTEALANGAVASNTAAIEAINNIDTGLLKQAKDYADELAGNYDAAGSAEDALEAAKAYTDELANGAVKANSDKIAALEALDYILNGDTVVLNCGGAE